MSMLLESALTAQQRADAVEADIRQAAALMHATAMRRRTGPLGPQHTMNEMERARAGIDHTGRPLR